MDNRTNKAASISAAGVAAGIVLTYIARNARARMHKPVAQTLTALVPRERALAFIESQECMLEAAGSKRALAAVNDVELSDAPEGRGTEIRLTMRSTGKYDVKDVLRRVKALLEAGEVPTGDRFA
ncbi:MAG: hypothetical protein M3R35_02680 [Candidatus Eremiobacteraeota bacterium]|nr:hypothetical protein [Candidatus Eremiobacteraeota bacterium]